MTEDHKDMDESFEYEETADDAFGEEYFEDELFEDEAGEGFYDEGLSATGPAVDPLYEDEEEEYGEDWDSYEDEGFEEFEESESPAKGKKSNRVIIAGGVVAALAVFYFVFGGGGGAPQQGQTPQPTPVKNVAKAPEPPKTQTDILFGGTRPDAQKDMMYSTEQLTRNKGLLNDPEALGEISKVRDEYQFSEEEPETLETPEDVTAQEPVEPTEPLMPMPESPTEKKTDTPVETVEETTVQTEESLPAGTLTEIDTKIDSLISKLETIHEEVETLKNATKQDFDTINNRVDSLATDLKSLEERGLNSAPAKTAATTPAKTQTKAETAMIKKPRTNPTPKPRPPQAEPVSMPDTDYAAPKPSQQVNEFWVLKGARPGQAIVSAKNSSETYTIVPGQNLSGIGTIQSIQQEDGVWTVRGAYGIIQP